MAHQVPVIASGIDTSLRNLVAILLAGGKRDHEIEIAGWVWPHRAKQQVQFGQMRAMRDSAGEVVCYKRARAQRDDRHVDPAQSWQKAPSGGVHVMQLKTGRRGRAVPASHVAFALV